MVRKKKQEPEYTNPLKDYFANLHTCKKCGGYKQWTFDEVCGRCKRSRLILPFALIWLLIIFILVPLVFTLGHIEFEYELDKCDNLKSTESGYDFDKTIELNAEYNEDCYYRNHNPLAYFYNVIVPIIIILIFLIMISLWLYFGILSSL